MGSEARNRFLPRVIQHAYKQASMMLHSEFGIDHTMIQVDRSGQQRGLWAS